MCRSPSGWPSTYPDPRIVPPPADFVARSRNLVRCCEPPRGGHFPALEVPDLLIEDLAEFIVSTPR
ncbi:hypothetical protein [Frankia sp. QA3]|uniref:hypothetical protein n=1 Tax=Frankia sp. QA3 TaxID=710111 RepID=UPI0003036DFA|nr:hypothetical protein [Frankia sp. QA3]